MANISTYLKKILEAVYGEEVRGSIHDALEAMNVESSKAMEYAATAKDSAAASASSAQNSASAATRKAEEALASADAAKVSETGAKTAENNAVQKATEANDAAAAAKGSETKAANSEATATQKAQEAAASESAAAISAANAVAAEERAKTVRSEVELLGAQVTADKNAAEEARIGAEGSKDAAKASEERALASENSARTSASDAANAKNAAEAAKTAAEQAKSDAEAAKEDAVDAKTAAEIAATNAGDSADAADASAKTAQQYSGKPPKPQNGTWWIWDAESGLYVDTGITCELEGPTGVGIQEIKLTQGDHTPGTTDIYTVVLTDGSSYPLAIYNGRNGTGAGDMIGISFDLTLPVEDWVNYELRSEDSRLLASSRYKYFLDAYDDGRTEMQECNVQPKDISENGAITFLCDSVPVKPITVNVLRFELGANGS